MSATHHLAATSALLAVALAAGCTSGDARGPQPSAGKRTVETYMEGFRRGDHALVLGCLTDDVEWDIPGMFHVAGKTEFAQHITEDAFSGLPRITVARLTEENGVVIAEGAVECAMKAGGMLDARFCDVFELRGDRIRKLTSYLAVLKQ